MNIWSRLTSWLSSWAASLHDPHELSGAHSPPAPVPVRSIAPSFTRTYVILEVGGEAFDEIAEKLAAAGYFHAFDDFTGTIDMNGIGLVRAGDQGTAT